MLIQYSFTISIPSGIGLNDTKQKNPDFILMTLKCFALPFSQSQNSITVISQSVMSLFVCVEA